VLQTSGAAVALPETLFPEGNHLSKRVSAQLKEVVVDADSLDAKDLRPDSVSNSSTGCWEQRFLPVPRWQECKARRSTLPLVVNGSIDQQADGTM